MRTISWVACVLTLALIGLSCDTTQPLVLDQQGFELTLRSTGPEVRQMYVYTGYEDNDNNGQPDGDEFLVCFWRGPVDPGTGQVIPLRRAPTSVPWSYYIEVTRLPAGETQSELLLTPAASTNAAVNVADYDRTSPLFGSVPARQPVTIDGRTFKFRNGRILLEARQDVMSSTSNPLSTLDPATYGQKGKGLCSVYYPGPPGFDRSAGAAYPFPITLQKGDTVTVAARRAVDGPQGLDIPNPPGPSISATFTLDGTGVSVRGTTSSEAGPGEGFTFSYTTR